MPNTNQAPYLHFIGDPRPRNNEQFYALPQRLMDKVLNELSGKEGGQIKIMLVLLGTAENFAISEKWICTRTGMSQQAYSRARQALVEKGWIKLDKEKHCIYVNVDAIYGPIIDEEYIKKNI